MPIAQIKSLEFLGKDAGAKPESASAGLRAGLEDGKQSTFAAATSDQPGLWVAKDGWSFGAPVLFVRRLDEETVAAAAQAMAADMGGYWLRYYNSPSAAAAGAAAARPARKSKKAAGPGCKIESAAISDVYPPRADERGCAVTQVRIADGREFSLLTATPSWFERAFRDLELSFYFGSSILFVRRLEPKLLRRAVEAMGAQGDVLLCRYDTPRRTLPEVLAEFKSRHGDQAP